MFVAQIDAKEEAAAKIKLKNCIERIENMKPDNQTAKRDAGKPKLTLVPLQILYDIAKVREYGNSKYGSPENWKDVDPQRYRDALFRHLVLYLKDPYGVDEESGLPHLSHIACNVAFLCQMHEDFKNVDEPYEDPKRDPSGCPLYSEEDGKCRGLGFECEYAYDYDCESVLKAYTAGAFDFLVDSVVKGGN